MNQIIWGITNKFISDYVPNKPTLKNGLVFVIAVGFVGFLKLQRCLIAFRTRRNHGLSA